MGAGMAPEKLSVLFNSDGIHLARTTVNSIQQEEGTFVPEEKSYRSKDDNVNIQVYFYLNFDVDVFR